MLLNAYLNIFLSVYRHLSLQDAEAQARSVLPPSTVPPPTQSKNSFGKKIDGEPSFHIFSSIHSMHVFVDKKEDAKTRHFCLL